MVEIRIDGQRCDVEAGYVPDKRAFSFDSEALADIDKQRTGRTLNLRLPISPTNDRIMGYAADPTAAERFNATYHEGEVVVDGVSLLKGVATLQAIEAEKGEGYYLIRIRDGAGDWIELIASRTLDEADIGFEATLNGQTIKESWSGEQAVRFLPVLYDDYREPYDSASLFPPQRVMTVADYYPFISVRRMLQAIFEGAGYTAEGRFMESEELKKLYFSGRYPSSGRSLTRLEESSGFKAARTEEATTTADDSGRVWLTPLVLTSSLGNIVDTAEGDGLYNHGGVLQITSSGIEYRPKVEASVSFEIGLKYTTDFKMLSSSRLQGFDTLYVDAGCEIEIPLANQYKDRRHNLTPGVNYRLVNFAHKSTTIYQLFYITDTETTTLRTFAAAEVTFTMPNVSSGGYCVLKTSSGEEVTGDWVIYDSWVKTSGKMEVEVVVQTPPERLSPSKGKSFANMYLHGGKSGQSLTLAAGCTLQARFTSSPAEGSLLTTETVLGHQCSQLDFVKSIVQMYNLRIATIEGSRKVLIEPYDDFYNGALNDISHYVEPREPMLATEMATEVSRTRSLGYRSEGDGAVVRHNAQSGEVFGRWSSTTPSYAAKMGSQRLTNALFCPTISATGVHATAPSALVMQVGDRDAEAKEEVAMRIVRYQGLEPLPEEERWGAPSFGAEYPLAAFHSPECFTLCFEDRDGVQGMHRHYDKQWDAEAERRRLSLTLTLPAHALQQMCDCDEGGGARDTYRLCTGGQGANYRLSRVVSYDTATGRAQCEFVRTITDELT